MANLTHVALKGRFVEGEPPEWHAECKTHQWAVKDGGIEAVEALIREYTREHPSVRCPPPPAPGPLPRVTLGGWPIRWKLTTLYLADGTASYSGQCGLCPSPGWNVLHHSSPVDAHMEQHWAVAHGRDFTEEKHG